MSEWPSVALEEIAAPDKNAIAIGPFGSRMKKDLYVEAGVPVIRGTNITGSREFQGDFVYVSESTADELGRANVFGGDLVFPHRGAIGEVGIVPSRNQRYMLSTSLMKFSCDREQADPLFLYYFFRSAEGRYELLKNASQVGTPGIARPLESLRSVRLKLPPLSAQQSIAHILGTLDDKIELNRRMNRTMEALARAIFKSWFIDFDPVHAKAEGREPVGLDPETAALFPDSFEDSPLGKIPKGWGVRTLGEVISLEYGKALKASIRQPGSVPVYGSNGRVGWHNEALVPGPGIVVGRKGNPGTVTWVAEAFFPIDTTFYVVPADEPVSLRYLYHALRIQDLPALAADSAVPGLNRNIAYENKLVLPSVQLLGEFECACTALAARVETNVGESRTLAQVRDALLPRLLSGQLLVAAMGEARADD